MRREELSAAVDRQAFEPRKANYIEFAAARAVRTGRWKYIAVRNVKGYDGQSDLLFGLEADPDEKKNLFKDPARVDVVEEMQALLRAHLRGVRVLLRRVWWRCQVGSFQESDPRF